MVKPLGNANARPEPEQPGAGWRLAVDFGTSNTAASAARWSGPAKALQLTASSITMPSGVLVFRGELYTGQDAVQQALVNPAGYEPAPKRRLGEAEILLDGKIFRPVELVQAVLRRVYRIALQQHNGTEPDAVVLTHPQTWRGHRLGLLSEAAEGAGIPPGRIHLVSEPVAAAWHYVASGQQPPPAGQYLAVLDFGGGTVDVALLRFERDNNGSRFVVVDQDGADPLGGDDFDVALLGWALNEMSAEGKNELASAVGRGMSREALTFRDQIRGAKHALSERATASMVAVAGGEDWLGTVTRDEFEQRIGADLDRAVNLLSRLLERNHVGADQLSRLYLSGGSSLIPALHHRLERVLPGKIATLDDPKQVTSLGALQVPFARLPPPDPPPPPPPPPGSTKTKAILIGVGIGLAALFFGGPVIGALIPDLPDPTPTNTMVPSATPTLGTTPATSFTTIPKTTSESPPSETPDDNTDYLLSVVPDAARPCVALVRGPEPKVLCSPPDAGQPSYYNMYSDAAALQAAFESQVGPEPLAVRENLCPGVPSTTDYSWDGVTVGQLACHQANGDLPALTWTKDDILVMGHAEGSRDGADMLWEWWGTNGMIG